MTASARGARSAIVLNQSRRMIQESPGSNMDNRSLRCAGSPIARQTPRGRKTPRHPNSYGLCRSTLHPHREAVYTIEHGGDEGPDVDALSFIRLERADGSITCLAERTASLTTPDSRKRCRMDG